MPTSATAYDTAPAFDPRRVPAAGPPVIIDAVSKVYSNGTKALDHIALTVADREFVTLVGPSGCGKSTLLRMVAGLGSPTSGEITVFALPPAEARKQQGGVAFVFQDPTLMPWRSVLANVTLPLELRGVDPAVRAQEGMRALELVGLAGSARAYPRQLSGGMKMRVSIARAMAVHPQLLLMDEPFGALDEITRQRLDRELQSLWARSRLTVLFVTHNVFEAVFMSTRILVMSPQPGHVAGVVAVGVPFPREDAFRSSPEFGRLVQRVTELLAGAGVDGLAGDA
jgi:NitT/TauT family transport system ATP-binding protein